MDHRDLFCINSKGSDLTLGEVAVGDDPIRLPKDLGHQTSLHAAALVLKNLGAVCKNRISQPEKLLQQISHQAIVCPNHRQDVVRSLAKVDEASAQPERQQLDVSQVEGRAGPSNVDPLGGFRKSVG